MSKRKSVSEYMYRYLEKYTGKYRVLAEYDIVTNDFPRNDRGYIDESFEDLYIPCKKGVIKHTYKDYDTLAICMYDKGLSYIQDVYNKIRKTYPNIDVELELFGHDGYIYFKSEDIDKIATIVNPRTNGAKIKWHDKRNLPKENYLIPENDIKRLSVITQHLSQIQKMQFMKKCNSEFLDTVSSVRFNAKEIYKNSKLSTKEFIHSLNMWDKYIEFLKDKIKECEL